MTTTIPTSNGNGRAPLAHGQRSNQGQPNVLQMIRDADAADRAQAAQADSPAKHAALNPQTSQPAPATQTAHTPIPTITTPFGGFSAEQIAALTAPLDRAQISSREQGRGQVPYLKSYVVINEANRIFGFDGWQRQTLFSRCIAQAERLIGARGTSRDQKKGWGVTYIARVRITVHAGGHGPLIREGTGAGHGIDTDLGLAHESAIKEAETDATKRALVTFGNPFGLALYDKGQRQVSGGQGAIAQQRHSASPARSQGAAAESSPTSPRPPVPEARPALQRPGQPATEPVVWESSQAISRAFNGPPRGDGQPAPAASNSPAAQPPSPDAPLEPTVIAGLQERLRGLAPGHREAFSRAFRTAFQVPQDTPSVAGLILQQRHRIWIEEFLAKAAGG